MPGKEIKGRSKIANYRHGGRTGKQFGGPLTQPLARPGVAQPGVAQPGVAQPGVAQPGVAQPGVARPGVARPGVARPGVGQPGVMPTRPLGLKDGGRTGFNSGGNGSAKKKKKETWKEKKIRKRKEESQQVSRDTLAEAVKDFRSTKGKVHTIKKGQEDSVKRINKLIDKQVYFHSEKELKKGYGKVRDKGWGGKHSQKKPEHN